MNKIVKEFLKANKNINFSIRGIRSFIYIVESANLYKIGYASDIEGRMTVIQTSSPHQVKLIYLIPLTVEIDHKKVEKALHKMFESCHVKGEWFDLSMRDIAKIKTLSLNDLLIYADRMEKEKSIPENQIPLFPQEDE